MADEFPERYLGDGVYATFDGWQVWIYASNGVRETERIALEPAVLAALLKYHNDCIDICAANDERERASE